METAPLATELHSAPPKWAASEREHELPFAWSLGGVMTIDGGLVLPEAGITETVTLNAWAPPETRILSLTNYCGYAPLHRLGDVRREVKGLVVRLVSGFMMFEVECRPLDAHRDELLFTATPPAPATADLAREVRDLSGLSAARLAELFPVERETYQRWITGSPPSSANEERLLAIRHFLRELTHRVSNVRTWLLAPLVDGADSPSAFEVLKGGRLAELWDAIADLPSTAGRQTYVASDGSTLTELQGSRRGRDLRTPEEELDDYAEWLGDDGE